MGSFKTSDDVNLYYNDLGRGNPIVLIHGWPLSSDMWEYQTTALLDRGYRVISYDRRGFGRSSQNTMNYTYDRFADDLSELLDHLALENTTLVGFSMGGGEIARYLSKYGSGRVSKAVLISAVVPYLLQTDSNPEGVDAEVFKDMIQGLKKDRPHFLADFTETFYGVGMMSSPVSDEILRWTAFMAYQASPQATIACVRAFGETDFRGDLKAFDIPTAIIHGSADKTVPIEPTARAAAKAIPNSTLKVYEGGAHGIFITHKDQLLSDLLSFLETDDRRERPLEARGF